MLRKASEGRRSSEGSPNSSSVWYEGCKSVEESLTWEASRVAAVLWHGLGGNTAQSWTISGAEGRREAARRALPLHKHGRAFHADLPRRG